MIRHFKHWAWAYGLLGVLIVWPVVLLRLQSGPPLDESTARALYKFLDDRVRREYGEPNHDAFDAIIDRNPELAGAATVASSLSGVLGTAVMAPELERLEASYGAFLDDWDALTSSSLYLQPFSAYFQKLNALRRKGGNPWEHTGDLLDIPSMIPAHNLHAIQLGRARRAIRRGQWEVALKELDRAARFSRPLRVSHYSGAMFHARARRSAAAAYGEFIAAGPPAEPAREALRSLTRLAAEDTDPAWMTGMVERRMANSQLLTYRESVSSNLAGILAFSETPAVAGPVQRADAMADPAIRAFGRFLDKKYFDAPAPGFGYGRARTAFERGLGWTTVPAAGSWLAKAAAAEPVIFKGLAMPEEERRRLDPYTLAALAGNDDFRSMYVFGHGKRPETTLSLLAAAARLFRRERGAWPGAISDLVPEYLPAKGEPNGAGAGGFDLLNGGFHLGVIPIGDEARRDWLRSLAPSFLWNNVNPGSIKEEPPQPGEERPDPDDPAWRPEVYASGLTPKFLSIVSTKLEDRMAPISYFAAAERMTASGAFEVKVRIHAKPAGSAVHFRRKTGVFILTPAMARALTDESAERGRAIRANLPAPPRTIEPPDQLSIHFSFAMPERAFAVWWEGEDGDDDGGLVSRAMRRQYTKDKNGDWIEYVGAE